MKVPFFGRNPGPPNLDIGALLGHGKNASEPPGHLRSARTPDSVEPLAEGIGPARQSNARRRQWASIFSLVTAMPMVLR